jgi:hypothetical protein
VTQPYEYKTAVPVDGPDDLASQLPLISVDLRRELVDVASRDGVTWTSLELSWTCEYGPQPWVRVTARGER